MARLHYRDGRWEEVAIPDGLLTYEVARFPPMSPKPWEIDPCSLFVERDTFQAADYMHQTEVGSFALNQPDLMSTILDIARDQGVPEYAEIREPERDIFRDAWILIARWTEYFEQPKPLPLHPRARQRELMRRRLKVRQHFLAWLRKVKQLRRELDISWHEAKRMTMRDPVAKLGVWSSLWPENVY